MDARSATVQSTTRALLTARGYALPLEQTESKAKPVDTCRYASPSGQPDMTVHWVCGKLDKAGYLARVPCATPRMLVVADEITPAARAAARGDPVELWTSRQLAFDPTRHKWVPPHTLASDAQVQTLGDVHKLPRLLTSDPIVRWYGWPVDAVVYVQRPTGAYYRRIVPN